MHEVTFLEKDTNSKGKAVPVWSQKKYPRDFTSETRPFNAWELLIHEFSQNISCGVCFSSLYTEVRNSFKMINSYFKSQSRLSISNPLQF